MNSFVNASIAYPSNNKFPGNFILNEYKKYKEKVAELESCFDEWAERTGSGK